MATTTTFNVQPTNLPVGVTAFPASTAHATLSGATITIDRSINNGLNSLPATTTLLLDTQFSFDNGATWKSYTTTLLQGGFVPDDHGNPVLVHVETEQWNPPIAKGTQVRMVCTVVGQPIRISGSVAVTG